MIITASGNKCVSANGLLYLLAAALVCQPAAAEDLPGADEPVEEIIVTGSRIVRRDFIAPSPIATVDRTLLENSGQATIEETLNRMPQISPNFDRTANNPGNGMALINLRGLGAGRNLVLLNGRRMAPAGIDSVFDLNNIPQVLIERVEIITGGAATVYGSDAIAGVLNFITRDDFDGVAVDASAYVTGEGDSEIFDINLAWGGEIAGGRGHLTLYGGYYERRPMFASSRRITEVPLFDTWQGELVEAGSISTPAGVIVFPEVDLGTGPGPVTFTPEGVPRAFIDPDDRYNFARVNYLQIPLDRYSVGTFLSLQLAETVEVYGEAGFVRNETLQNLAPVPAGGEFAINLDNPLLTPEARQLFAENYIPVGPDTVGFVLRRRLEELGPRIAGNSRDYVRALLGVRGDLAESWDYDVWASWTQSEAETLFANDASRSRLQQGLFVDPVTGECLDPTGGCVPLDIFGAGRITPEAAGFLGYAPFENTSDRTQKLISGFVRGEPVELPAGPLALVFGAEWRSDEGNFAADDVLFSGDTLGFRGAASVNGRETVTEVFGEALVPLLKGAPFADYLAVEFGYRYSVYDRAGTVDTWKYGGEWSPVEGLRFRAMVQRSVRAPNLPEAFAERLIESGSFAGNESSRDPCSASADPAANGNVEKCVLQGIPRDQVGSYEATAFFPTDFITGGNPSLAPEVADTVTIGAVLTPFDNWTLAVDAFELDVEDTIGSAAARFVCFSAENVTGEDCDRIRRDPVSFNVVEVDNSNANFGRLTSRGVDVQLSYATELPGWLAAGAGYADLSVDVTWTHVDEYSVKANAGDARIDCNGRFGWPCIEAITIGSATFPEDRIMTSVSYIAGDLDMFLAWRWIGGTDNAAPLRSANFGIPDPDLAIREIGSVSYFDLGAGYRFNESISAHLNVTNVLDNDPPLMASAVFNNNTDSAMFDVFGRAFQLTLALRY